MYFLSDDIVINGYSEELLLIRHQTGQFRIREETHSESFHDISSWVCSREPNHDASKVKQNRHDEKQAYGPQGYVTLFGVTLDFVCSSGILGALTEKNGEEFDRIQQETNCILKLSDSGEVLDTQI